jgi:sodium/proline symporter
LNAWVAALSTHASDMLDWLMMGPVGRFMLSVCRIWIAAGLAPGTILNWLLVAKRIRRYSLTAGMPLSFFEKQSGAPEFTVRTADSGEAPPCHLCPQDEGKVLKALFLG